MKRQIPLLIVFLGGFMMLLDYFLHLGPIGEIREIFANWARIAFTFAMYLGIFNLIMVNAKKVLTFTPGWGYNLILLLSFLVTAVPGILKGYQTGTLCGYMFDVFYTPLSATMFGLLAFFIASAAFRAFRAKNVEAALLLVTAIIVMLGNIPLGDMMMSKIPAIGEWLKVSKIQNWIMVQPTAGAQRAILIAAAVGAISFSLRILAGLDRSYFGGEE